MKTSREDQETKNNMLLVERRELSVAQLPRKNKQCKQQATNHNESRNRFGGAEC
jgi:hypothetical protein